MRWELLYKIKRKFYTLPYRTQHSRNYEIHTPSKHIIIERETNHAIAHCVIWVR